MSSRPRHHVVRQLHVAGRAAQGQRAVGEGGVTGDGAVVVVAADVLGVPGEGVVRDEAVLGALHRRRRRREVGAQGVELGLGDGQDRAVAGAGGQLVARRHLPVGSLEVVGGQRDVAAAAVLVDEEVVLATRGVTRVALEDGRTLDGRRAGVAADAAVLEGPRLRADEVGLGEAVVLLLDDVGAAGAAGALVLGEAVVGVALLDHGGVDAGGADVLPGLRLAEGHEVAGRGVEHPVVGAAGVPGVVVGVELRRPEHDVLLQVLVPVGLRRPGVARGRRGHQHVALRGPVLQVGGLPDLEVAAALALRAVPVAVAADGEVGGDQEEAVALGGADEERVAQAHLAERRVEHRLAAVELVPAQRVVAAAGGEVDLLAGDRVVGEVAEGIAGVRRGRGRLPHGEGELPGGGRAAHGDGRGQGDARVTGAGCRAGDDAVGSHDRGGRGGPGDGRAVGARRRQRQVTAYVVGVHEGERGGGRGGLGLVALVGQDGRGEGLRRCPRAPRQRRGQGDLGGIGAGTGPGHDTGAADGGGRARRPADRRAEGAGRRQRQVGGHTGQVTEAERLGVGGQPVGVGQRDVGDLGGGQRPAVDPEVLDLALEGVVGGVVGLAEHVVGRDAVADGAGQDGHSCVLPDLDAVLVERAGGAGLGVGDRLPHATGQGPGGGGGGVLLVVPPRVGDARAEGVARGHQVARARRGTAHGRVAEAEDEVVARLAGLDVDVGRDGDGGQSGGEVVGQLDVVVDAVQRESVGPGPGAAAAQRAVAPVARGVRHDGARGLGQVVAQQEAVGDVGRRCGRGEGREQREG